MIGVDSTREGEMHFDKNVAFLMVITIALLSACDDGTGGTDAGPDTGPVDAGPNQPVLISVSWEPAAGTCQFLMDHDYAITVVANDPDTDPLLLTISGFVEGCNTPTITGPNTTIGCPNAASTYPGRLMVVDPDGNMDTGTFSLTQCAAGSVTF